MMLLRASSHSIASRIWRGLLVLCAVISAASAAVDKANPDIREELSETPIIEMTGKRASPDASSNLAPVGNPLWGVPLSSLTATQEMPLFTPSRQRRQPAAMTAPVEQPPTLPAPPERSNLHLIGTILRGDESIAVFIDHATQEGLRLRIGEGIRGWVLVSVEGRSVILKREQRTEMIEFPKSIDAR